MTISSKNATQAIRTTEIGKKIRAGEATLEECAAIAVKNGARRFPSSGKQEYIENVINQIFFK